MIVEVLMTSGGGPVSKNVLDAWVNTYKLPVTSVKDPDGAGTVTFNTLGIRETVFELDLRTMKILKVVNGHTDGTGTSSGATAIQDLLVLLGNKGG